MGNDLPDYQFSVDVGTLEASSLVNGADAGKSATPSAGDVYLATDTLKLYICATAGVWTGFDAAILIQGTLTLYAALAGGGFKITNIADPAAAQDAATKAYADGLVSGLSSVVWKATNAADLSLSNQTATVNWTALDLTAMTSVDAKLAILWLYIGVDSISAGAWAALKVRKNGDTPTYPPYVIVAAAHGDAAGAGGQGLVICGLDSGQVLEYTLLIGGTIQVDAIISVLGYIE